MALALSGALTFTSTQVVLTNSTGNYSGTNLTGYGSPNALFTAYSHRAIIRKKNVNSVADVVLTLDTYNAVTAESFTTTRDSDGWYEGILLDILIWVAGTYASGYVVSHNGIVYQSNQSTTETPGAGSQWTVVSSLTSIETHSTVVKDTDGRTTPYNADVYWSRQIAQNSQRGRCGICEDDRQKERLDKIEFHINAVLIADQQGNNDSGEWNVLRLIELGAIAE